jgi:ubiquinone/menaquinone biosynthesis C-methylase UbiE
MTRLNGAPGRLVETRMQQQTTRTISRRTVAVLAIAAFLAGLAILLGPFLAFHLLPSRWTGEADRLAQALGIGPGSGVAEIGAGSGDLAAGIAARVGPGGRVYATEIDEGKRQAIADLAARRGLGNLHVLEAGERSADLPDGCCDAIFMRNVLHHIDGWSAYLPTLLPALRPGGRVGIIDFSPGALFHLAGDHGAEPDDVIAAFEQSGFTVAHRNDAWGGRMYLIVFVRR